MTVQRGQGDPEGRRIARRRNLLLAEAGRAGRAFAALLRRADYDALEVDGVLKGLGREETSELLRSSGRVESRKRFKYKAGEGLRGSRSPNNLFLDESGQSHPLSPVAYFALGGVAMTESDAAKYMQQADDLKREFFGRVDITFHEPNIRNHASWFWVGGGEERQRELCEALDNLVAETDLTVFGVAIRKDVYAEFLQSEEDPYLPADPYSVAIHMLLERYVDCLATRGDDALGHVTFESVGPREDAIHHREYIDLLLHGTQWVSDSDFRRWLATGCSFTRKQGSDPMELADMFSRDLFEWVRGGCGSFVPRRWDVWQPKVHARDDLMRGRFGIKVFPDSDIRDRIEGHRSRVAGGDN